MSDESPPLAVEVDPKGPWRSYKERISRFSRRIVRAQEPIRILNAVKWPAQVWTEFQRSRFRALPPIEYSLDDLGYDPVLKREELIELEGDIRRELGDTDPIAAILIATAREYRLVVEMLERRGTPAFYELSRELYGSSSDIFADGVTSVRDIARDMYEILTGMDDAKLGPIPLRTIDAEQAVVMLNERLAHVFGDSRIRVIVDDGIAADAAAGSDYVKIRAGAKFSLEDIRLLEVHEGWAHIGTSMNGQAQPVASWLAKGPPRTAATQEGLASLLEVLTFASHPTRAHRLNNRVLAVDKAECGASFYDVFEWFRTEGYDEETCFWNTQRIFRGGTLEGGAPFTKDIVYMKGIVQNYNFLHAAIAQGRPELIRWLFVGKVALPDIPVLEARAHEGLVRPPHYVPEIFNDLRGIAIWLSVGTFWSKLNSHAVFKHYEKVFSYSRAPV